MNIEYNYYGFASSACSLEQTIQVHSEKNSPFFFQIKSYRLPIQKHKESNHHLAVSLRMSDQEPFTHYKYWIFYRTQVSVSTFISQKGGSTESRGDRDREEAPWSASHPRLYPNPTTSFSLQEKKWGRQKAPRVAGMIFTLLSASFLQGSLCHRCLRDAFFLRVGICRKKRHRCQRKSNEAALW